MRMMTLRPTRESRSDDIRVTDLAMRRVRGPGERGGNVAKGCKNKKNVLFILKINKSRKNVLLHKIKIR